jgi:hypothetical protein
MNKKDTFILKSTPHNLCTVIDTINIGKGTMKKNLDKTEYKC